MAGKKELARHHQYGRKTKFNLIFNRLFVAILVWYTHVTVVHMQSLYVVRSTGTGVPSTRVLLTASIPTGTRVPLYYNNNF